MKTFPNRSLLVAAAAALMSLCAQAAPAEESWWQQDDGTLGADGRAIPISTIIGVQVDGAAFCAVAAFLSAQENVWLVRGQVIDGRLVEASRTPIRGPAVALARDDVHQQVLRELLPKRLDPPDFFLQPTALVSRHRTTFAPRGSFAVYQPAAQAPSASLWLDLAWHCGGEAEVDRMAATARSAD
ncbi:hypothetical protein [Variovorax sp. YR752]|uniref:hypothetical protein n=1 Tax=Variovorax sp. YR752 TaxID=1884383 RepID=UPI0031382487